MSKQHPLTLPKPPLTPGKVVTTRCDGSDGRPGTCRTLLTADGTIIVIFTPDKPTTTRKPK